MEITLVKNERAAQAKRFNATFGGKGSWGGGVAPGASGSPAGKRGGTTPRKAELCGVRQQGRESRGSPRERPSALHGGRGGLALRAGKGWEACEVG